MGHGFLRKIDARGIRKNKLLGGTEMETRVKIAQLNPLYLRTGKMASLLGRSIGWLKANKGVTFKNGIHYHQPKSEREPFWDVEKMDEWVRSIEKDDEIDLILKKVV